ncbi:MAG: NAD(+) diphosphatase [Gammaproteobacteria bacterium]|nr:NAD(+) diphosphatase [Pseudomonadales bacterium]MCB1719076.1 NAD(+) diphosphatase [Candidatus Competibacteraceae bacterium]MCP5346348.1 NAD(+) diphosphatase [Pseudomonadales bacterium]
MSNPHFVNLPACNPGDRLLIYCGQKILFRDGSCLWQLEDLDTGLESDSHLPMLIEQRGEHRYLALHVDTDFNPPAGAEFIPLRQLLLDYREVDFQLPGLGNQLTHWYHSHRFCGRCGHPNEPHPQERALRCPACEQSWYPRINPCVIVLVTDGERMLLARHSRYKGSFFSCLAGFIEVGETPEQTVVREVREEAGIEIGNIRYVRSQAWPFPSQLMLGFFADYLGGELRPEPGEIEELKWFLPDAIPATPAAGISVAGQLIQLHRERFTVASGTGKMTDS